MKRVRNFLLLPVWLALWLIGTAAAVIGILFDVIEHGAFRAFDWLDQITEDGE